MRSRTHDVEIEGIDKMLDIVVINRAETERGTAIYLARERSDSCPPAFSRGEYKLSKYAVPTCY